MQQGVPIQLDTWKTTFSFFPQSKTSNLRNSIWHVQGTWVCFDMFSEWSLSDLWVMSKWSLDDIWVISKWSLSDFWLIPEWSLYVLWMISEWTLSDLWLISECVQSMLWVCLECARSCPELHWSCSNLEQILWHCSALAWGWVKISKSCRSIIMYNSPPWQQKPNSNFVLSMNVVGPKNPECFFTIISR